MQITRVYTGDDGESHFDDFEVPLRDLGAIGQLSELVRGSGVVFRETGAAYDLDFHNAPRRQLVVMLSGGGVELETGSGAKRRLYAGDVLLAEDTTGRGHISRAIDDMPRVSLFLPLDADSLLAAPSPTGGAGGDS
jgi:hypothetical protein